MEDNEASVEECYHKLEKIKIVRQKTIQLEKMKLNIKEAMQEVEVDNKLLDEYKTELSHLGQEKMAYVEELRQIHTDIDAMERLIKEGIADRKKTLNDAQKMILQYKPLQMEVDTLRQEIGLQKNDSKEEFHLAINAVDDHTHQASGEANKAPAVENPAAGMQSHDALRFMNPSLESQTLQTAPMKICTSCHHHIHRNAPICPMCKAKSRSRNPKKPKKTVKQEEL